MVKDKRSYSYLIIYLSLSLYLSPVGSSASASVSNGCSRWPWLWRPAQRALPAAPAASVTRGLPAAVPARAEIPSLSDRHKRRRRRKTASARHVVGRRAAAAASQSSVATPRTFASLPHHHTPTARRAAAAARRAVPGRQCTCESERLAARASLCRNQVGSAFDQLALRRLVSAPTYAPRCPRLRPASANQPWGGFGPVLAGHLGLAFDTGAPSRSSARRRRPAAHRPRSSTTFSPRSCRRPKPS